MKASFGSAGCTATHHGVLFSAPGSSHGCQLRPASQLERSRPVVPGGPSPLQRKIRLPSVLGTTARVYCHGESSFWYCQVTPLSSLECRPRLVVASTRCFVTAMPCTSADTSPASARCQCLPPSSLRKMPPISIVAHSISPANRICVTRVGPRLTSENSATPGTSSLRQLAPPSSDEKSAAGRLPAISREGFCGSCAIAQTSRIGDSSSVQRAARSSQRYTPSSVPAYMHSGNCGWLHSAQTRASRYKPEWLFGCIQVSPRSSLNHAEWPAVPA